MAYSAIDIGPGATNRADAPTAAGRTRIAMGNPANASGVLTSFELWFNTDASDVKIGTFSGSSASWDDRDYESLGSVTAGSKQTFTGKNCDVSANDIIGVYSGAGKIEQDNSGGDGVGYYAGDAFGGGAQSYTLQTGYSYSCYATGVTIPDAPTDVSATDTPSNKVTITWTAGTGETGGHRVYRDGVDISGVVAHGTATFDDTTGVIGTVYAYTVKAINDAGLSAASSADNGVSLACPVNVKHKFIPSIGGY